MISPQIDGHGNFFHTNIKPFLRKWHEFTCFVLFSSSEGAGTADAYIHVPMMNIFRRPLFYPQMRARDYTSLSAGISEAAERSMTRLKLAGIFEPRCLLPALAG